MFAASLLAAISARADAAAYAQVVKERDAVLSQILAEREGRRSTGLGDEEAIAQAQLALYAFRRDVAATTAEKINQQERIVRIHEQKLERVKARRRSGVVAEIDVLEATAPLLEARQALEALRLGDKRE